MKKNKLLTAITSIALAIAFTGCYNPTNLQETKSEVVNKNATAVEDGVLNYDSSVTFNASSLKAKTKDNTFTVTINSPLPVDPETFTAFTAIPLSDPTEKDYYVEGDPLTISLFDVKETYSSGSKQYTTTLTYTLDLSDYDVNKVGFRANATILKDVKGNFILNNWKNNVAGEEYDSVSALVAIADATTILSKGYESNLRPSITKINYNISGIIINDSNCEKFWYTVNGVKNDFKDEYLEKDSANLAKIFKYQTLAPGETEWKDGLDLSFTWNSADKKYKTQEIPMPAPGTKVRTIRTVSPDLSWTLDGVEAKITEKDYSESDAYDPFEIIVYPNNTNLITSNENISSKTKFKRTVSQTDIFDYDASLSNAVTADGFGAVFTVKVDESELSKITGISVNSDELCLKSTDGFLVTTKGQYGYKKVPSEVTVLKKTPKGATTVVIKTVDNTYKFDDLLLWVGNGTSIYKNEKNKDQVNFGAPLDASKGDASGYVEISFAH